MALTITATVGSASANSFVTEAEVIAYMATRLNTGAWVTFSGTVLDETEKAAVLEATRELSTQSWHGLRVDDTQALAWPRRYAPNPDSSIGSDYLTTAIPQRVKDACAELAFQVVKAGTEDIAAPDRTAGIVREQVDTIATEYAAPFLRATGLARFPSVTRYLRDLLTPRGGFNSTLVRG